MVKTGVPEYVLLFALLLMVSCSSTEEEQVQPLATIANKYINKNELIRRAEYTIRPPFCRGNGPLEKKIVLNSLIAEKLLAMEAGEDNELTENEEFQAYLTGRKEQAMREYFYYDQAYNKVALADTTLKRIFRLASFRYKVNYITLRDSNAAKVLLNRMGKGDFSLAEFYHSISGKDSLPSREVAYFNADLHPLILEKMYRHPLKKGQRIGPLKTAENQYIIIQVKDVTKRIDMEPNSRRQTYLDVKEKETNRKAGQLYSEKVSEIMAGKSVTFNPAIFKKIVRLMGPQYLKSEKEFKQEFKEKFWQNKAEKEALQAIGDGLEELGDQELLNFSGETWTVKRFEKELAKHPLVFRNRHFNKKNFAEEFKLAIVDMVRDREITRVCYENNYDNVRMVKHNYEMWKDNLLSLYQKRIILQNADKNKIKPGDVYDKILNPHIRKLQSKYSEQIKIDIDKFNEIKLTRIDMMALQQNVPFPIMVPGFPQLIDDHRMDYGKAMKTKNKD